VFSNDFHNQLLPYLCSICQTYAQWWKIYTLTDVVGKQRDKQQQFSPLLDLMVQTVEPQQREEGKEKIERLAVIEGLRKYAPDHVLLVGRPGSGKSTALVRLLLEEAERGRDARTRGRGDAEMEKERDVFRIPVLVELRFYQHSVLERVKAFLLQHDPDLDVDEEILQKWLRQGRLLLLLDGFNELPTEEARQQVRVFRKDYPKTPMVFTTRHLQVGGDLNISKKLEMQPLTDAQMRQFVCAYLPQQGEQMLRQLGSRLREFGETPLLLWMLCSVFASNSYQIPANLGSVFRRFTEKYDYQLKQGIVTDQESRDWWQDLLQHLAWVMTQGKSKTELMVAISRQEAKVKLTEFLRGKVNSPDSCARRWLQDLLDYHLIQVDPGSNQLGFCHQLLLEYYTAENLLQRLGNLSNQQLKWDYLNYLKWTEPFALMMQLLEDQDQAVRVVKLALEVDWFLGARLAGEVKSEFQEETVGLVVGLSLPRLFKVILMGATKSDKAIFELTKALESSDYEVRRIAADALEKIGSDAVFSTLINALEYSDYRMHRVRNIATNDRGEIGSGDAVISFINALKNSDYEVRERAALALGEISSDFAIPYLIKTLEDDSNYDVRWRAAEALGKIGSDAAVTHLIKALKDPDYGVRFGVAEALGKIGSDAAVTHLIKALKDPDYGVRFSAAEALGKIGSDAAIKALIKALEDSNYDVRCRAADALKQIGSNAAIKALIKALEDSNYDVRCRAADALGKIGSEIAVTYLINALKDSDYEVRRRVAEALGKIGSEAAVLALIGVLEDYNSVVRKSAAEVLGKIAPDTAIPELITKLQDHNFAKANRGNTLNEALKALKTIQEHCQYYRPTPKLTMSNPLSHNYALLIGVGESAYPEWSLPVTVKDTLALKSLLTNPQCGYIDDEQHLRLLNNAEATTKSILSGLDWLQQQAAADSEATVLVYYSGHGWLDNTTGKYYLIPHDIKAHKKIPYSALAADTFQEALQQIPAKRLLVIIDSCHAAGMASAKNEQADWDLPDDFIPTALPKDLINQLQQGTGRVVLTSSTGKQQSWVRPDGNMSIYTFHLLEALQGAGNQPGDQVVTVSNLMNYLGKTVPASVKQLCQAEQIPFFDFATEDFAVSLLHGGKGLPQQGWDGVKAEAQERISQIGNVSGKNNKSNVGDRTTTISIGTAGDIKIGDISS